MEGVTRSALFLAALASAAMPGLDPTSVQRVRPRPDDLFDVAWIEDTQDRQWVVKAPRTPVAGAMLEDIGELSALLGRRLDIAIPMIGGQVVVPEGRAVVQPRLAGKPLDFSRLPEGLGLAADVGRALAHVHNLEIGLFEEAGRPEYDAEAIRGRRLVDLDRAAATGQVPTGLLARWERSLEDVSLWRFLPTPVHGSFTGAHVLAAFDDEDDAVQGRVTAILGWEMAHVGDPAEDFSELAAEASTSTLHSVLEAYGPSRIDRPDPHLLARARLASEMTPMRRLLAAAAADAADIVDRAAQDLRLLEERVFAELESAPAADPTGAVQGRATGRPAPDAGPTPDGPQARAATASDSTVSGAAPRRPSGEPDASMSPKLPAAEIATVAVPVADSSPAGRPRPQGDAVIEAGSSPTAAEGESGHPHQVAAVHFEIEEAERLDDAGVLDQHEGASEFVVVQPRARRDERPAGDG